MTAAPALDFPLTSSGLELDPEHFGWLRESIDLRGDSVALQERFAEDGYLYMPGLLHREQVLDARRDITKTLAAVGALDAEADPMAAVAIGNDRKPFRPDLVAHNEKLERVLYSGPMMDFFATFFGSEVLHFDFTWFRTIPPGVGTRPHCDVVYMGRGSKNLLTCWTPIGDISLDVGGLIVLEGSHKKRDLLKNYLERDVDSYCTNGRHAEEIESGKKNWEWDGTLSKNPVSLRERLGGRWLTAKQFRAGDALIFGMSTVHASLDNHSNRFRLSSDSRYQPASEPADERWIGANPIAHGLAGKRGRVC